MSYGFRAHRIKRPPERANWAGLPYSKHLIKKLFLQKTT
jgi:hypothetical protein